MKITAKLLSLVLALVMMLSFAACGGKTDTKTTTAAPTTAAQSTTAAAATDLPEIKTPTKFDVQPFSFKVNDKEVTEKTLANCQIYKITVTTTNKSGEATEATYAGYAVRDVLDVLGIKDAKSIVATCSDGYETAEYAITDANAKYTLIAIEKDKETGKDGTIWFAPCAESVASNYGKLVTSFTVK